MFKANYKYLVVAAVLAATLMMGTSEAKAFWGWGGYWGCGSCYTYCCDGWYVGIRPGPIRRALFGPYRWYYGGCGWGCNWGSCYCGSCCWDFCYSDVCCSSTFGTYRPATPAPTYKEAPRPAPTEPPAKQVEPPLPPTPGPQTRSTVPDDSGLLTITVPAEATVFINGLATRTTGTQRTYVSKGLKPDFVYKYEVRAQVVRNGELLEDTRQVYLTAGADRSVAITFPVRPQRQVATVW